MAKITKISGRIQHGINTISLLDSYLKFYLGDKPEYKHIKKDIEDLYILLEELGKDRKDFSNKLWHIFELNNKKK